MENNYIHHAGEISASGHNWADGISLSCLNSRVANNLIEEATDGAIVIFGSPGSTIEWNTIRNVTRNGIGGIAMVDTPQYRRTVVVGGVSYDVGDYSGTVVQYNTIEALTNYCGEFCFPTRFQIGIAMGPRTWFCNPINGTMWVYGGTVRNNTINGNYYRHPAVIDGVLNWTVTGNTTNYSLFGASYASSCGGTNGQGAFIRHGVHALGTFQPQFVEGQGHHAHPY